jgi:hypothetical protein
MMCEDTVRVEAEFYEIRIKGHLSDYRAREFAGMSIELQYNGETVISGSVVDQAALFGLLIRIRDLGMPLLSVGRAENPRTLLSMKKGETK